MTLKIISANEIVYQGEATSVTLPGGAGAFTVLENHASLVSTLSRGKITCNIDGHDTRTFDINGGLADVDRNIVNVCLY